MKEFKLKTSIMYDCTLSDLNQFSYDKALVVCDPFFIQDGTIDIIKDSLSNINTIDVYSKVSPDPTLDSVVDGISVCSEFRPDIVIAIGGGSAIDLAKAITFFDKKIRQVESKLLIIPTTSGTGSEVTSFAVISDTQNKTKIPLVSDELLPDYAFLENDLIKNLPQAMIAYTGMDALTHNIEAYVSNQANNYSDSFALQSLKIIKDNLIESYESNLDARNNMHQAATMAGLAFNEAGLGINHAIAHQLGAIFHIPHGKCNAILLPHLIKFNAQDKKTKARYNQLAYDLHLTHSLSNEGYTQLIRWINKLNTKFKIEKRLSELNIERNDYFDNIELISDNALKDRCMPTNPKQLEKEDMIDLLKRLY